MSWMVSGWIKKSRLGSGPRKGVMLVVADYCTEDGRQVGVEIPEGWAVCWAGIDLIAAEAEVSERTVRRVLDDMEAAGVIRRDRRHDPRGYRTYDFIWVEYARAFADLAGWSPDTAYRSDSPVGDAGSGNGLSAPVDNPDSGPRLPDSQVPPTGLPRHRLPDSHDRPPHPPIRNNPQEEPPTNHQDHLGNVRTDRTRARRRTRSSSPGGPAPPATGQPDERDHREERHG